MLALATSVRRQVSWLTGHDPLRLPGYPVADCIGLAAYSCGGSSVAISDRSGFPLRPVAESYRLKGTDEACIMPALPGARTDAPSGLCEDIG